jgi:hypothetical protein
VSSTQACHQFHYQGYNQHCRIKHEENESRPHVDYEVAGAEAILIEELV